MRQRTFLVKRTQVPAPVGVCDEGGQRGQRANVCGQLHGEWETRMNDNKHTHTHTHTGTDTRAHAQTCLGEGVSRDVEEGEPRQGPHVRREAVNLVRCTCVMSSASHDATTIKREAQHKAEHHKYYGYWAPVPERLRRWRVRHSPMPGETESMALWETSRSCSTERCEMCAGMAVNLFVLSDSFVMGEAPRSGRELISFPWRKV